jgi:hypothetical protein
MVKAMAAVKGREGRNFDELNGDAARVVDARAHWRFNRRVEPRALLAESARNPAYRCMSACIGDSAQIG